MDIIKNIKGTKDILGEESFVWQYLENKLHNFFQQYGYQEIRTPAFEDSQLFNRSIGKETDIVSKEMYSWTDQGGNNLTLKPELTASVVRAFIQHNLGKRNNINKLYYIDSLFRRERPQKGRFRQFTQFGVEAFGSHFPEQDAEVISLAYNFYKSLEIKGLTLKINSIGSKSTRQNYKKILQDYFKPHENDLTDISKKRLSLNPLRILDTKIDFEKELIKNCPKIIDYLSKEDEEHYKKVLLHLDDLNIKYKEDNYLVRGLDYYCRTVFEIHSTELGAQSALCGGGRYDYLVEELGGKSTPAIGFAAGLERLILSININQKKIIKQPDIYIVSIGENAINYSIKIADLLRTGNQLIVMNDTLRRSPKSQMKEANKYNAKHVIMIGDDEIKKDQVIIKNMDTGDQKNVLIKKLSNYFS